MVRPRKTKFVGFSPKITYFKPQGIPLREMEEIELTVDELETLRLANIEKLSQTEAALKMDIHQSTFQRTLTRAREKMTDAIVHGKAIRLNGGEYKMVKGDKTGPEGKGPGTGRGLGFCSGNDKAGFESEDKPRQGMGRGLRNGQGKGVKNGQGRGLGRGQGQNKDNETCKE